jgi:adenylate kinase family enzyme
VPLLGPGDDLPGRPRRVLVAGTSGAGKTTLAATIGGALGLTCVELDALFHGPGWTPRPAFVADVERLAAGEDWVTEWQYDAVRGLLASRADLLVWLDLPRALVLRQLGWRTVVRRLRGQELWNGNREPPLRSVLTDPEHVLRWAWATHSRTAPRVEALRELRPELTVVRLRSRSQVDRWVCGPLRRAGGGERA